MSSFQKSIFLFVTSFFLMANVYGATVDEMKASIDDITQKIQTLDKEIAQYNKQISQTQGQAKTLKQAITNLEVRRAALLKEIDKTKLNITKTEDDISKTQSKISVTQQKINNNNLSLAEIIRGINQQENSAPPMLGILEKNSSISSALDVVKRSTDVSNAVNEKIRNLQDAKVDLSNTKQEFEVHKKQLIDLNKNLSDQKQLVEQTKADKNQLLSETKNKESEYQKLLADRKQKKDQMESELGDIESKLTAAVDLSKLPSYGSGALHYPVDVVKITQYFGNTPFATKNPQVYNGMGHNGVDFGTHVGTVVYSAADGIVAGTGNTDAGCVGVSYGKWVLIRHNNGLSTLYAHLSVIDVTAGQSVTTHQRIALSGNTGYSTGPHVHFTVYASSAVHITSPTEYKSKVCGTYMIMPIAPRDAYLNPLTYLPQ